MKARGGSKIIEKNRIKRGVEKSKKRRHVEYLVVGYKVDVTFIIIFRMCRRKSVQ
jgi:Uri superfamily endonuclease